MKHYIPLLALIFAVSFLTAAAAIPKPEITLAARVYESVDGSAIVIPANPLGRSFVRIQNRLPLTTVHVAGTEIDETESIAVYFWDYDYPWVEAGDEFTATGTGPFRVVCVDIIQRD